MSNITDREIQVAKSISHGATEKEIGNALRISIDTVKSHKRNLFNKTGSRNIADLTRWYIHENEGIKNPSKIIKGAAYAGCIIVGICLFVFPSFADKFILLLESVAGLIIGIDK